MQLSLELTNEEWVPVAGIEAGHYEITKSGEVRTVKNTSHMFYKKIMTPYISTTGYWLFRLCINGKRITLSRHRMLAMTFIPNPDNKPCVNHINAIKTDNRLENLEWCTKSENSKHAYDLGIL